MQVHSKPIFRPDNIRRAADEALKLDGIVAIRLFDSEHNEQRQLFYSWWWGVNYYEFDVGEPHEANAPLVIGREVLKSGEEEFGVLFDLRSTPNFESIRDYVLDAITQWFTTGKPDVFETKATE